MLLTFDAVATPLRVGENETGTLVAYFEIGGDDAPQELRAYPNGGSGRHVAWHFK